jgi:CDGSH-type Zn-finger protein
MSDITIEIKDNGPYLIKGSMKLVDGEGNEIAVDASKPAIALCRCGASKNLPYCDGSHKACGFESAIRSS